jgi:RNA polymerase sigma factor (sigma-70 family)
MVRLATLLTGSVETAEELVMDAFTRLAPRIDELDQPAAYLRTAVVNATRSHHRRVRTARAHAMPTAAAAVDPEIDELWQRLDQLRPDERACVVLRFYEDLPLADIATQLDLPLGTVKSHLHRAIATLRTLLTDELTEEDR